MTPTILDKIKTYKLEEIAAAKEAVPEIEEILDVTDHTDGRNPYYKAPA